MKEEKQFTEENNKNNEHPVQEIEEQVNTNLSNVKRDRFTENTEIETKFEENARIMNDLNERRKPPKYIGVGPKRQLKEENNTNDFTQYRYRPQILYTVTNSRLNYVSISRNTKNIAQSRTKYKTPIRELEEKFRTNTRENDDPPYNFRAMLRKTNFSDTYNITSEVNSNTYNFTLKKVHKSQEPKHKRQVICTELVAGLIVEGEIADL